MATIQHVKNIRQIARSQMRMLLQLLEPGTRLTLIARTPGNTEAEFIDTQDNLQDLADAVQRAADRQKLQTQ